MKLTKEQKEDIVASLSTMANRGGEVTGYHWREIAGIVKTLEEEWELSPEEVQNNSTANYLNESVHKKNEGNHANYIQVLPNSHYWTELAQILHTLKMNPYIMGDGVYSSVAAHSTVRDTDLREHLITGLKNTLEKGYDLRQKPNAQETKKLFCEVMNNRATQPADSVIFKVLKELIKDMEKDMRAENILADGEDKESTLHIMYKTMANMDQLFINKLKLVVDAYDKMFEGL